MTKQLRAKYRYSWQGGIQRGVDGLVVAAGFILAHHIYSGSWASLHVYAAVLAAFFFLLVSDIQGVYQTKDEKLKTWGYGTLATSWVFTGSLLLLLAYATKTTSNFSRVAAGSWFLVMPFIFIGSRLILNTLFSQSYRSEPPRRAVVAGYSEHGRRFMDKILFSGDIGIVLSGLYLLPNDRTGLRDIDKSIMKGDLEQLVQDVKCGLYDEVYIVQSVSEGEKVADLISDLSDCSIPVFFVPDMFTVNLLTSQLYHYEGMSIVGIYDSPMDARDQVIKRLEDLVLSALILVLVLIPMVTIAIAIKINSKGPVIFRQRRYGLGGESIEVWKFRSMKVCDDGELIKQATKNDERLTSVGVFLRRTSLDELPQFINVLIGDMSIVGPRPHAVAHNELYRKKIKGYMLRHLVKPGITGWAQVNGWRGETDTLEKMEMRVQYDLEYIKHWSLWFDLKIVVMTIYKGLINKNAY